MLRLLVLPLLLCFAAPASAQFLTAPDGFVIAALPYLQPEVHQNGSATITKGQVDGRPSTQLNSEGSARVVGYRMYYWEIATEGFWQDIVSSGVTSYGRTDPQFIYWFGSCAILECSEQTTTTNQNGRVIEGGWEYVDWFPLDGGVLVAEPPSLGAFGAGVHVSVAGVDPPNIGEASGLLLVEAGPQVSHVFTTDLLPIYGLTTASYVFGYDVSGGGFGSTAIKLRTDLAFVTPLEIFGTRIGIGASYFWDSRSISGEDVEADVTFHGLSYGLTISR